jgi:hypothetical protein
LFGPAASIHPSRPEKLGSLASRNQGFEIKLSLGIDETMKLYVTEVVVRSKTNNVPRRQMRKPFLYFGIFRVPSLFRKTPGEIQDQEGEKMLMLPQNSPERTAN